MENPIKMDDLGLPLFSETSILDTAKRLVNSIDHFLGNYFNYEGDAP